MDPDHALSFNYSDAYERIYGTGKSELLRRIGGTCKTIEFIPQTLSDNEQ